MAMGSFAAMVVCGILLPLSAHAQTTNHSEQRADVIEIPVVRVPVVVLPSVEVGRCEVATCEVQMPDVAEWVRAYGRAIALMGEHGLYEPDRDSPMGRWKSWLLRDIGNHGSGWTAEAALLVRWELYWSALKATLDRRERSWATR